MNLTKNLPYQPLQQDDSLTNHPISDVMPSTKIIRVLRSQRSRNPEQIRKERPRILHQISLSDVISFIAQDLQPERDREVQSTIANLKQLRFLKIFSVEMERSADIHDRDLKKLIKSLNRIKIKDQSIFYVGLKGYIHDDEIARFCRVIRQIDDGLKRDIMLDTVWQVNF